jgi:hypothetical protein
MTFESHQVISSSFEHVSTRSAKRIMARHDMMKLFDHAASICMDRYSIFLPPLITIHEY